MASKREELHKLLCEVLGSNHVYFQPPESVKLKYPAIIYSRYNMFDKNADNQHYIHAVEYKVIVVDPEPDSEPVERLSQMREFRFTQHYENDNLNHDVFTIYY